MSKSKNKFTIKIPKPKQRIPVAPPTLTHKNKFKYDRKQNKKIIKEQINEAKDEYSK